MPREGLYQIHGQSLNNTHRGKHRSGGAQNNQPGQPDSRHHFGVGLSITSCLEVFFGAPYPFLESSEDEDGRAPRYRAKGCLRCQGKNRNQKWLKVLQKPTSALPCCQQTNVNTLLCETIGNCQRVHFILDNSSSVSMLPAALKAGASPPIPLALSCHWDGGGVGTIEHVSKG